jgi:hypothetical protein
MEGAKLTDPNGEAHDFVVEHVDFDHPVAHLKNQLFFF